MSYFSDLLGPKNKCPKCDSANINTVKGGGNAGIKRVGALLFFLPALLFIRSPKPLYVCRDCGFSWEKR